MPDTGVLKAKVKINTEILPDGEFKSYSCTYIYSVLYIHRHRRRAIRCIGIIRAVIPIACAHKAVEPRARCLHEIPLDFKPYKAHKIFALVAVFGIIQCSNCFGIPLIIKVVAIGHAKAGDRRTRYPDRMMHNRRRVHRCCRKDSDCQYKDKNS